MDEFQVRQQERISQQQVEQQVEPIQLNPQQQQMHDHLVTLQSWDLAPEQTLEQRRAQQAEHMMKQEMKRNSDIREYWKLNSRSLQARKTAEGQPTQIQAPAKKTYKQRREDRRLDAVAREKNAVMDHISLRMMESLGEEKQMHDLPVDELSPELKAQVEANNIDMRVLNTFVYGYKKDANGEPEDPIHARRRDQDRAFLADYISGDLERRKPHLDRMLKQVMEIDITEEMFKPEYMEYHAGELREKINQLVYFENVSQDPINKPYFDALPQLTKDLIKYRVSDRYAALGQFFTTACCLRGVDANNVRFIDLPAEDIRGNYSGLYAAMKERMSEALTTTRQQEREMLQRSFDQMYNEKAAARLRLSDENILDIERTRRVTDDKKADMTNLNLTAYAHGYSLIDLANCRQLIENNPQRYQKHAALVDTLYQQLYRSIDALGDWRLVTIATEDVMDDLNNAPATKKAYSDALIKKATILQDEAEVKKTVMEEHINEMMDALKSLMKGQKLSKPAKKAVRQLGFKI